MKASRDVILIVKVIQHMAGLFDVLFAIEILGTSLYYHPEDRPAFLERWLRRAAEAKAEIEEIVGEADAIVVG